MPPSTLPQAAVRRQAKNTLRQPSDKKNKICKTENKYAGQKKEFHGLCQKKSRCEAILLFFQFILNCCLSAVGLRLRHSAPALAAQSYQILQGIVGRTGKITALRFSSLFSEWWKNSPPEAGTGC